MSTRRKTGDVGEIIVSTDALAKLFGYTRQRINQLAQEGILEKQANGRWPLMKNVQRFIDFLKTGRKNQDDDEHQAMFWEEKALHEKAKREMAEIKLAKLKNQMHDAADVEFVMTNMLVTFRNRILAIPDKVAPKVLGVKNLSEISDIISTELHEALTELSEYDPALFVGGGEDAEDDTVVSEDPEGGGTAAEADGE
jgi:phage terminase Nu1 subunit (DNA packaging protein)